jgi:hypothetical protein
MTRLFSLRISVIFAGCGILVCASCDGAPRSLPAPAAPVSPRVRADRPAPTAPVPTRVLAITAGASHSCAVLDDHSVKCWGWSGNGSPRFQDRYEQPGAMGAALPRIDLGPGRTALAITAGVQHTCVLLDDHTVKCWGANRYGELGLGDKVNRGEKPGQMGDALPAVSLW